jgi:hypothetical protein
MRGINAIKIGHVDAPPTPCRVRNKARKHADRLHSPITGSPITRAKTAEKPIEATDIPTIIDPRTMNIRLPNLFDKLENGSCNKERVKPSKANINPREKFGFLPRYMPSILMRTPSSGPTIDIENITENVTILMRISVLRPIVKNIPLYII